MGEGIVRSVLFALSLCSLAWAGPDAVLVVREQVLEKGRLVEYTGTQRYPVQSEEQLKQLIRQLSRAPRPARFVFDPNKGWIGVQKLGYRFDAELVRQAYQAALEAGKPTFVLPVVKEQPKPSVRDLRQRGIVELVGEGHTNFAGSPPSRIHNIRLAAARFDRVQIPPGTVFSFNQTLGPVTRAAGYQNAWVIRGNQTVWDVGGGVCQVCTTLFRAAYFSGLPIVERHPHSYQVGYYKPTGLDATTAPPKDLRFKNDTPAYLLIQSSIQGQNLVFRFFGTKDREVTWRGPVILWRTPPLPTRYIYDATLPAGYRRQIDFAAEGALVRVYRTVRLQSGEVQQDVLESRYKAWGAVYLVGPRR
ncbi:MAG: vancomycin B-type resistance protein vanW [Meiothermus sp.]|nr:MAG: vancomycin B-type resistance protein vanW [Meiothermus sp.]